MNVVTGRWKNLQQETTYAGLLQDTREVITPLEIAYSSLTTGNGYQPPERTPFLETTYLTNLMAIKDDIGKPFTSQDYDFCRTKGYRTYRRLLGW